MGPKTLDSLSGPKRIGIMADKISVLSDFDQMGSREIVFSFEHGDTPHTKPQVDYSPG